MNNILDQSTITATAVFNSTLSVASGKLLVSAGGVTANELAADAVTTTTILDANVTTAKIAELAVSAGKIASDAVTTAKILDANITAAKILDANITAAKLSGAQTGAAPVYGARAWVVFQGRSTNGTATINASGNVSSVTRTAAGRYTIVMTTGLPDANYAFAGSAEDSFGDLVVSSAFATKSVTTFGVYIRDSAGNATDANLCSVIILR
jgi:hypothetical protein